MCLKFFILKIYFTSEQLPQMITLTSNSHQKASRLYLGIFWKFYSHIATFLKNSCMGLFLHCCSRGLRASWPLLSCLRIFDFHFKNLIISLLFPMDNLSSFWVISSWWIKTLELSFMVWNPRPLNNDLLSATPATSRRHNNANNKGLVLIFTVNVCRNILLLYDYPN